MTKVIVCGGRDYVNYDRIFRTLDALHLHYCFKFLAHGDAGLEDDEGRVIKGADKFAGVWAVKRGVDWKAYPALWKIYGDAAGPIRNRDMLRIVKPDVVVAFNGGAGTANMMTLALRAGVPVIKGG